MIEFTIETEIRRPVEEVFGFATDPSRLAEWQTNTVSAVPEEPGPMRVGTRIREVHRAPGGKRLESLVEVAELEPDRVFALRVIEGTPIHARIVFDSHAGGTTVAFTAHGGLTGAQRLLEPLIGWALRRQFTAALDRLRVRLEQSSAG
jgi:uncharacterized protein YndB with AHSA1/START domain